MKYFIFTLVTLCSVNAIAFAEEEFHLATIDITEVVNSMPAAKSEKATLDAAAEKAKKLVEAKREALRPLQEKARNKEIDPKSKEADQLRKQSQELIALMKEKEDELQKGFAKSNKALTDKAYDAVQKYAREHNLQMVVDRTDKLRGVVLYGEPSLDITDAIIKMVSQ